MDLIRALYSVAIDALFPVHPAERAALSCGPEGAWKTLPRAPMVPETRMCGVFAYKDERVSRLVWAIKYKKSREGAAIAGYALYMVARQFLSALPVTTPLVVVPMPITRKRRRERGYNQCELIMEAMMRLDALPGPTGWPAHQIIFAPGILSRERHTSRQTLKDRQGRIDTANDAPLFAAHPANIRRLMDAVGISDPAQVCLIVIDDVITTGSTMKAALDALRGAGFSDICGVSVAH
jgi:predicted amidophosphoribosyltransferase